GLDLMDRRSWLWRRSSSEKSPTGETESSGGSVSSHSERFSDDQMYSNRSSLSPEVTSKAELQPEEFEDNIKTLSEKLSAALRNISLKEDLVQQHSKVAVEAVEGWEKAENEVSALRKQLEVLTLRNSTLENRVSHLDGALKECLRQLRQTREENDQKFDLAIEKKTSEWQITKIQLENQLSDLRSQLQSAKKSELSLTSTEKAEKEISALKLELASMAEELEIRFIERELSNQAAEQASKLHLESSRKAAKFEAECRRLNAALKKALASNNHQSFTDAQSNAESDLESNKTAPPKEIKLMDDFLEMEKLVALPAKDSVQNRMSEVEELLKRVETEKTRLEIMLNERENELKTSRNELKDAETKLIKMEDWLNSANNLRAKTEKELALTKSIVNALQEKVKRSEMDMVELKTQLDIACKKRKEAESQLEHTYSKKNEAESRLKTLEAELNSLLPKVGSLETEVEKERAVSGQMGAKCRELENEISKLQRENQYPKAAIRNAELRVKQDTELALAGNKFADCQKTIASLSRQLNTLATLEDFLIDPNEFNRRF
nr:hypothetical protein [Tanacetum cinerariifolium]